MENSILDQFIKLVLVNTGIEIHEQDREKFHNVIALRMKSLHIQESNEYHNLLNENNTESSTERNILANQITIGESYFFRDKGQIDLLKKNILPSLIKERNGTRSLRIWSAGCSTGEEAYTIAILIKELIPFIDNWNILILGTDINDESIEKAKQGIYTQWSLRNINPEIQAKYFKRKKDKWEFDKELRKFVTFKHHNLINNNISSEISWLYNIDLIICRNVFIYFNVKTRATVLKKLTTNLREGGYLITGHAELCDQNCENLVPRLFRESVVYQCASHLSSQIVGLNDSKYSLKEYKEPKPSLLQFEKTIQKPTIKKEVKERDLSNADVFENELQDLQSKITEAELLYRKHAYDKVIRSIEPLIKSNPDNYNANYLLARSYANSGKHELAIFYCNQSIRINMFSAKPYFLKAHIMEEQGQLQEAKELLKKSIYLEPDFIPAYLELGSLFAKENNHEKSSKLRATGLELLKELPPGSNVEPYDDLTVSDLILHVQNTKEK